MNPKHVSKIIRVMHRLTQQADRAYQEQRWADWSRINIIIGRVQFAQTGVSVLQEL